MRPIRVVQADKDPAFLEAAALHLGAAGVVVTGSLRTGRQVREHVGRERPDAVLIDLFLDDGYGLTTTLWLKSLPGPPRVIIVSALDEAAYRALADAVQVDGFVRKSRYAQEIVPLLETLFP